MVEKQTVTVSNCDDAESEGVIAILDINILAAVAADAIVRGGSTGVAAVDDNWLATLGACYSDVG